MRLFRQIRALVTMIVLASHTPIGHVDQLGISLFVGRLTRVAAAQQFDPTRYGQTCGAIEMSWALRAQSLARDEEVFLHFISGTQKRNPQAAHVLLVSLEPSRVLSGSRA